MQQRLGQSIRERGDVRRRHRFLVLHRGRVAQFSIRDLTMRQLMQAFYRFLLAWTRIDIQIARSTGRNPANILALRQDEDEYSRALCRLEMGL